MRSPRHLWTGEWRTESERAREAAAEATALRAPAQPQAPAPADAGADSGEDGGRRRGSLVLGLVVAALALVGGAFAAGMLLGDGEGGPRVTPLPAVSSKPIKPSQGQTRAGAIYAAASPAVVSVRTGSGEGTGFLIDRDGTVVTNAHVVGGSTHVLVRFGQDGDSLDGDVLGTDPSTDLAVVSIDAASIPKGTRPLKFVDSRMVQVGDLVVAIGNPFGLDRTATEGIVSGLGRSIQAPNGFSIDEVIQTDAPINPGNSGGPLLDDHGRVIGVNSQILNGSGDAQGGNVGIGFAVPASTVRTVIAQLVADGSVEHAYLGVQMAESESGAVQVAETTSGGPAEEAGLQPGDELLALDGEAIDGPDALAAAVNAHQPGDEVTLTVRRTDDGAEDQVTVTLGTQPQEAAQQP